MFEILNQLKAALKKAVKEKNGEAVSALRFFLAGAHNEEIAKQRELSDDEVWALLRKQVKRHQESIEAFQKGGRQDLVQKEEKEKAILESFLPPELSEDEIRKIVQEVINSGNADFGQIMGQAMGKLKGKADGSVVARIVKEELGKT